MNNYKTLFSLRILKSILATFVDSFLVLYFLDVSSNNILPLGIYKLVAMVTVWLVIFLSRNYCKSKYRLNLLRTGIILNFIYFLTIILLKDKVVNYIYLVGLLYGLEEGFYYSVYNNIESDGVTNDQRAKFTGNYTAVKSILSIIFPLIFGSLIYATGFIKSLIVVLIIVLIQIILSFFFKDRKLPNSSKTNLKEYNKIVKNNIKIKNVLINRFFTGLTYSEGAFAYIVTIYIIKVFSNSVSLGIFTSIFSFISFVTGLLFAKCIRQKHYTKVIKISMTFTIILLCLMIYKCNFVTIVLFNLFYTFTKEILSLIDDNSASNVSNLEEIKKVFKVEYWLSLESALFIGRVISNTLFILMAFTGANIMIYIFVIFMILLTYSAISLQKSVKEDSN